MSIQQLIKFTEKHLNNNQSNKKSIKKSVKKEVYFNICLQSFEFLLNDGP